VSYIYYIKGCFTFRFKIGK